MSPVNADDLPAAVRKQLGLAGRRSRSKPSRAGTSDRVACPGRCSCGAEFPTAHAWEKHWGLLSEPGHRWEIDLPNGGSRHRQAPRWVMTNDPFPSLDEYTLRRTCPKCKASPGQPCTAPRMRDWAHMARIDAAFWHRRRDVPNAPWPEDRVLGARYDTLPDLPSTTGDQQ